MMKNDKIIVVVGVLILIFAAIGVYYWVPQKATAESANTLDFLDITGSLKTMPDSISVSSHSPFNPLIATPLAVNYDETGEKTIIPMYVIDFNNPSTAILRLQEQLDRNNNVETIKESETPKNASLRIASTYWKSSQAALLIEDNEQGYNLGVVATPLASYLRIPVIVTNDIDTSVTKVLNDLGVKKPLSAETTLKDSAPS